MDGMRYRDTSKRLDHLLNRNTKNRHGKGITIIVISTVASKATVLRLGHPKFKLSRQLGADSAFFLQFQQENCQ